MKKILSFILVVLLFEACSDDFTKSQEKPKVVVEGYIENGKLAKVFLTFPFGLNDEIGEGTYENFINSYAKVVITSDSEREVLTFKKDENLLPPYYYSTMLMTGEPGKTYRLEIIFNGDTVTSVTTIPPLATEIDSMWFKEVPNDTVHKDLFVSAKRISTNGDGNYFKFFTRTQRQTTFFPLAISTYREDTFGEEIIVEMAAGGESFLDTTTSPYFAIGDTVTVKASVVDPVAGEYWRMYDNETGFNNPFSNGSNLPSNVNGGLGVWTGMNSVQKQIIVK